ncbi:MAG: tRNA (adenosine(37)-N6)-threonylcarbamoyltransferase complex dimerization subunit type 1 TsaB [Thermoguttaceae bacterium]|nr:tRNA (adenosine(37)-N6)-threonylcarbamoyltransferase complex dimerization subunit type 1 TsaB [Thermoguttaceae bacterium]
MGNALKILALETTDAQGSVALCVGGEILTSRRLETERRSAQTLAPTIQETLTEFGWAPRDVDAVAVAVGPGSFTGLRVGVATAKMFAWAVGAKIVGVDALEAIAAEIERFPNGEATGVVSVGIDAQRGDAAVRRFWLEPAEKRAPLPLDDDYRVTSVKKWFAEEKSREFVGNFDCVKSADSARFSDSEVFIERAKASAAENVYFCGPSLDRWRNKGSENIETQFVDAAFWAPTAAGVARVAWRRVEAGDFDEVWSILPVYSRLAAAEERAQEKAAENAANREKTSK